MSGGYLHTGRLLESSLGIYTCDKMKKTGLGWRKNLTQSQTAHMILSQSLDKLQRWNGSFEISRIEEKGLDLCTLYKSTDRC